MLGEEDRDRLVVRPLSIQRRSFLRIGAAASLLPLASLPACNPQTAADTLLAAVEVLKKVFKLVEDIRGSFVVNNPGSRPTLLQVASKLLTGDAFEDLVDTFVHEVELPAGADMMLADWGDVYAETPGMHLIEAQEGGNDPVQSDPFGVME